MIQDFNDKHKGETCLIIGNGPSLDQTPLEELARVYTTFGANKIYDSACHPDFIPDYWACVDQEMLTDCIPYLLAHPEFNPQKFVPREYPLPGSHGLNVMIGTPFSKDAAEFVTLGGTVTMVNLQLTWYMGFTTALLVGVDHRYPRRAHDGVPGSKFIGDGVDEGHFQSKAGAYFSAGRVYNRPELDMVGNRSYPIARKIWEGDKRKIINLTPGTALEAFEKQDFKKWL